jgi:hypothetical protein
MGKTLAETLITGAEPLPGVDAVNSYQPLVWMGMPLVGVIPAGDTVYLTVTSSLELDGAEIYFAVRFSRQTFADYRSGHIETLESVIRLSGDTVYYSGDLVSFAAVASSAMPDDDKVVFGNTWRDLEAMITEELPDFMTV